jgi:hypothetical protein
MSVRGEHRPLSRPVGPHTRHIIRRLQIGAGVVAFVLVCFLWVINCTGPRPSWSHLRVQPPSGSSQSYQVSLEVTNTGPGHGQIDVVVRLKSKRTGQTYEQDQTVMLQSGETSVVNMQIGAPPGQYTPEVDLQYPPG